MLRSNGDPPRWQRFGPPPPCPSFRKKLLALLCINVCLYAFLLVFNFGRLRLEVDRGQGRGHCKMSGAAVGLELEDEAITWLEKTSNWIFYLSF
jgi:hypothetical protein